MVSFRSQRPTRDGLIDAAVLLLRFTGPAFFLLQPVESPSQTFNVGSGHAIRELSQLKKWMEHSKRLSSVAFLDLLHHSTTIEMIAPLGATGGPVPVRNAQFRQATYWSSAVTIALGMLSPGQASILA